MKNVFHENSGGKWEITFGRYISLLVRNRLRNPLADQDQTRLVEVELYRPFQQQTVGGC